MMLFNLLNFHQIFLSKPSTNMFGKKHSVVMACKKRFHNILQKLRHMWDKLQERAKSIILAYDIVPEKLSTT